MRAKFIHESVKHLGGRSKDEIDKFMKGYSIYDRFFVSVKEGLNDVLKEIIKTKEYKNLDPKLLRQGLVNACFYGNKEIMITLLENGAKAIWVNLDWIEPELIPWIKFYRLKQKRKYKNKT